jgi:hypothetical protein
MSANSEPANSLRELGQALADLSGMPRRVQVQQVLPLVEKLQGHGFTFAEIAKRMDEAGLSFQPNSLKLAVHRWRKKQGGPAVSSSKTSEELAQDQLLSVERFRPSPTSDEVAKPSSKLSACDLLSKARLQEIRAEHIDLDEIKRLARQIKSNSRTLDVPV